MRLTSIVKYSLYNIVKRRPVDPKSSYLPLYKSRFFSGTDLSENLSKNQSSQRYRQFFPFMVLAQTDVFKPKLLVTALDFNPDTEALKITSLHAKGIISQQFSINNVIPITYADMRAYNKSPEPILPTYIDETMTYFNRFNHDTYIFEYDGEWNEETANHPKLSLQSRLNEKQWFDRRHAY